MQIYAKHTGKSYRQHSNYISTRVKESKGISVNKLPEVSHVKRRMSAGSNTVIVLQYVMEVLKANIYDC